jgi:hypothetical protein
MAEHDLLGFCEQALERQPRGRGPTAIDEPNRSAC